MLIYKQSFAFRASLFVLTWQSIFTFVLNELKSKKNTRCHMFEALVLCCEEQSRDVTARGFLVKRSLQRHGGGRLLEDPGLKCKLFEIAVDRRTFDFPYI